MPALRLALFTALSLLAFAGNSLLCRLALRHTAIDAGSFTTVRLLSGALVLAWVARRWRAGQAGAGQWGSALALTVYAAGFSWAYTQLSAGTGALLLFGAVQATMIGHGLWAGERLRARQAAGLVLALAGLLVLLLPGVSAPAPLGAALMLAAGVAWGVYSLRGRGAGDPTRVTAGNFWRAAVMALGLSALSGLLLQQPVRVDAAGLACAIASGALTSGLGYALWYAVLPRLSATTAATVQLSVPVMAALGGVLLLGEALGARLVLAGLAVLGGIAMVVLRRPR